MSSQITLLETYITAQLETITGIKRVYHGLSDDRGQTPYIEWQWDTGEITLEASAQVREDTEFVVRVVTAQRALDDNHSYCDQIIHLFLTSAARAAYAAAGLRVRKITPRQRFPAVPTESAKSRVWGGVRLSVEMERSIDGTV